MNVRLALVSTAWAAGTLLPAGFASAVTIDGQLDGSYGPALSTQTTQTNGQVAGDNTLGQVGYANGSELDQAYATISGGVLYLFFTGNLYAFTGGSGPTPVDDHLEVFIDTKAGGQGTLLANNPSLDPPFNSLNNLAGLTFDAGFAPDYWFGYHGGNLPASPYVAFAGYAQLPTGGAGIGFDLGNGTAGGPGTLSGGTNPNCVLVTIDNRNVAGVIAGCSAASGAGVTTGIEWAIPLAAIGNPTGCFKVCAFIDYQIPGLSAFVSNQVLGPLPPGTCMLGSASTVNFAAIAGSQNFQVCGGVTPALQSTWGSLKVSYR